jgi:phage minor structural protein
MPLKLLDKTEHLLGYLPNAKEVRITEVLNNEYLLSFITRKDDHWTNIVEENIIECDGQKFIIKDVNENRQGKVLLKQVTAHHIYTTLIDYYLDSYIDFQAQVDIYYLMDLIVAGTPFTYSVNSTFPKKDVFDFGEDNKLKWTRFVQNHYQAELEFDGYHITLHEQRGLDNGVSFRYGKNLKSVTRNVKSNNLITRLYGYGKDGLTIEGYTDPVTGITYTTKYIDSQYINNYPYPKSGKLSRPDIEDQGNLLEAMKEHLSEVEVPKVSYEGEIVELAKLGFPHEGFRLGDTITVRDQPLGIDVKVRIVEYEYYPYEPQRSTVKMGNHRDTLEDYLANMNEASKFVHEEIRPNKGVSNLLKGVIDTFATQINTANSKLYWNEGDLIAVEYDANGADTGRRVKINSAGLGVSTDGGQTYDVAITGSGILANKIIVNAIYALMSEDGYTRMIDTGIEVYDNADPPVKRVHLGQYAAGKFGLEMKNKAGDTTIVDEDGLIQTDTIQEADNVDATHPLKLKFYIDDNVLSVEKVKLAFSLEKFRAYSTGAASGGGSTVTSSAGGYTSKSTLSGGGSTNYFFASGGINFGSFSKEKSFIGSDGNHAHTESGGGTTDLAGSHYHGIYDFYLTVPSHTHDFSVPDHSHSVGIPNHTHSIVYGIYEGTSATGIKIIVDGVERDSTGYTTDQSNIDLTQWITTPGWHTIELTSTKLGRINASLYIKSFVGM